jgi:sulfite reductase alpha subunit-like flavoprotein
MKSFIQVISDMSHDYLYKILYSSQTGTAEDIAYKIHAELCSIGLRFSISSADEVEIATLPQSQVIIFIISTTGDGDMPTTMQALWRFLLKKSLPNDSLGKVKLAVFGLGDSSYEKYNSAAR